MLGDRGGRKTRLLHGGAGALAYSLVPLDPIGYRTWRVNDFLSARLARSAVSCPSPPDPFFSYHDVINVFTSVLSVQCVAFPFPTEKPITWLHVHSRWSHRW